MARRTHIDVVQEMLSGTEQNRPDGEMQLVNRPGEETLPNSAYATASASERARSRRQSL
jgi:hypothetical protein